MTDGHIQFRNPAEAFENAIHAGRLSDNPGAENYAGRFMYMHTAYQDGPNGEPVDYFKNINTRKYTSVIV